MLINRNRQFEEQLLLGKLQVQQWQFARQAGAAEDAVWRRKMNLPAGDVTHPRRVPPSWPLCAPEVTVSAAAPPSHPHPPLAPLSPLWQRLWGRQPQAGAKHRELPKALPPAVCTLTSHPFYAEVALETPAGASEDQFYYEGQFSACRGLLAPHVGASQHKQRPSTYFMPLTSDAALVKVLVMVFSSLWLPQQGQAQRSVPTNSHRLTHLDCPTGA